MRQLPMTGSSGFHGASVEADHARPAPRLRLLRARRGDSGATPDLRTNGRRRRVSATDRLLDGSAIGLSGLCLAHCLLLPVAAALLPVLGAWADAEWVHGLFVVVAAPLSGLALLTGAKGQRRPRLVLALAASGLVLLLSGAFMAATRDAETMMTVAGSLCLAGAHIANWRRRARANGARCVAAHHCGARPFPTGDL